MNIKKANLILLGVVVLSTHAFTAKATLISCPTVTDISFNHLRGSRWQADADGFPGWRTNLHFTFLSNDPNDDRPRIGNPLGHVAQTGPGRPFSLSCDYDGTNFNGSIYFDSPPQNYATCTLNPDNISMTCI